MGGPGAPDDLAARAPVTQAWLAVSDDAGATSAARYFYHQKEKAPASATRREDLQDLLLDACAQISGVPLP